jgi:hypothetical protein
MKNSHLTEILKVFSQKEIKEFSDFLHSPFFNKNKSIISLFEYLKKYYPEFPGDKIRKEKVYAKIFDGAKYNDGFMRKIMFMLSQLAEDYLIYKGFKQNKAAANDILLQEYHSRNNAQLFTKAYRNISASKKNKLQFTSEQFYYVYLSSYRYLGFGGEHKSVDFTKFASKNDLLEPLEYLNAHYYASIMNLYEYYLNTQRMLNIEFDHKYFEDIIGAFDNNIILKYPLIRIHFNMIKMLAAPEDDKYFFETKELMRANEPNLEAHEVDNININLQNYCMRKIRANKQGYSGELFELYKMELERNNFSAENNISVILYRNIIFTALQLGEVSYAEIFAENYRAYLPEEIREPNYFYVKAHISLKKKDFEIIGYYLSKIKSIDELLKADVKAMYIPMYYETGAVEQFFSVIDTFKHFLRSNQKLSEERKQLYETFINLSYKLMAINENYDEYKLKKLKEEIDAGANIINKGWLLEKIKELENIKGGI